MDHVNQVLLERKDTDKGKLENQESIFTTIVVEDLITSVQKGSLQKIGSKCH